MKPFAFLWIACAVFALANSAPDRRLCRKNPGTTCTKITECVSAITANRANQAHNLKDCGWDDVELHIQYLCCPNSEMVASKNPVVTPVEADSEEIASRLSGVADLMCRKYTDRRYKANHDRVLDGDDVGLGEIPHMVALGTENGNGELEFGWCGGTLISERYVLTAAHCQSYDRNLVSRVRLGMVNIKQSNVTPVEVEVKRIIPYRTNDNEKHDIALIELTKNITFNENVHPACLYVDEQPPEEVSVSGWGSINRDDLNIRSNTLKKAHLRVKDNKKCVENWKQTPKNVYYVCAEDDDGKKDTCKGDSGGPLHKLHDVNSITYHVIGVTSNGLGCGGKNNPGLYTKVSRYIAWIERTVWNV